MSVGPGYLFVVPWPVTEEGGVNQVVLNLYREFEAGRAYVPRVCVTSWNHKQPLSVYEDKRTVVYMRVRPPIVPRTRGGKLATWFGASVISLVPELLRLVRFLRSNDVECINVHYPSISALQFVLARRFIARSVKIILSFHGLDLVNASYATGLERWLWKVLLRRTDAIVSCSYSQTSSVLEFAPFVRSRAATVHNGIDVDRLMCSRNLAARIDGRLRGRRFILSVASYEPKKGLDTLLHAFEAVRRGYGVDAMLALVGPDLGSGDHLRNLAAQLGILQQVVFCGEVPHRDLHTYYRSAEVFCLASHMEPFGIVLLEAGAFRCPIVATAVGGIPEILEHDVTARLVPPDDPIALAAQLQRLLSDGELRSRLADALNAHVRAHFTWQDGYRSYMNVIDQIDQANGTSKQLSKLVLEQTTTLRD